MSSSHYLPAIRTQAQSEAYRTGWDNIFGKKKEQVFQSDAQVYTKFGKKLKKAIKKKRGKNG